MQDQQQSCSETYCRSALVDTAATGPAATSSEPDLPYRGESVPRNLTEQPRELRRHETPAEEVLWNHLRNRQLAGARFRRQHLFGAFILDFYCHSARLVIECDGSPHRDPDQRAADRERDEHLRAAGLTVLRFWNGDILNYTQDSLHQIAHHLHQQQSESPSPCGRGDRGEGLKPGYHFQQMDPADVDAGHLSPSPR